MKARITEKFACYYQGKKLTFKVGAIAEGWPAKRAIAAGKAVSFSGEEAVPLTSPETKILEAPETK